jgi:hypothetical protein
VREAKNGRKKEQRAGASSSIVQHERAESPKVGTNCSPAVSDLGSMMNPVEWFKVQTRPLISRARAVRIAVETRDMLKFQRVSRSLAI